MLKFHLLPSITRTIAGTVAAALALSAAPAIADTIVYDVNGMTVGEDGRIERFHALVYDDDGRIVKIVKEGEKRPRDVKFGVDGKGRYLLPGMIDAHVHVMQLGFTGLTLDLSDTTSLQDALEKIRRFAAANPARPWILGRGWNQEKWGLGRFPTAAELDAVVGDRPVWLSRVDGHASWANSMAMKQAGVTAQTADPDGGRIIRKAATREPEGVFVDAAEQIVAKVVPAPRPADRDAALREAQSRLFANGITAVADMGTTIEDWQTFRRAGDVGALKLRIMAYADSVPSMQLIAGPAPTPWLYQDRLRLNGLKLYLDGALGSRGARLKQAYSDEPGHFGLQLLSPVQLRNLMSRAASENFQVAVHAIGDAANEELLSAIEEMADSYKGDRRWRIEHAQIVDPADVARMGRHGIIASMQPLHQSSDWRMAEARLGPDRLDGAYAWRSIAAAGGRLAFGSDAPVEPADAFAGLAVAISRMDGAGEPFGGWRPQEAIAREAALAAFTSGAAYAGFAEGRFGRLVVGERADFILVDRDPLLASPQELRDTRISETWVNGQKVFDISAK